MEGCGRLLIESVCIQNFTVFENLEIKFKKGINVLVGTNGTGKTHLLKAMYAISEAVRSELTHDLAHPYFSVDALELIRNQKGLIKNADVSVYFSGKSYVTYSIKPQVDKRKNPEGLGYYHFDSKVKSVFIPAKEMLSHAKGFLALNNKYDIPFDKTYVDILTNAELPEAREVSEFNEALLKTISKVIDGEVIHESGKFYIVKTAGNKVEFPIEAEGFRKFGLLWKLISNGLLEKGTILFWDEPEANINPELMPVLVEILMELGRKGVQIFIATHSYNLAKYFEVKRTDNDDVLYHHLYKTENGVQVESNPYFGELKNNPIVDADAKLLDEVIEVNFNDES